MASKDFKFMGHWTDKIMNDNPVETQKNIMYLINVYASTGVVPEVDDKAAMATFHFIQDQIDLMQKSYEEKFDYGHSVGRKATFSAEENSRIYSLACQGLKVKEIAKEMGITQEKMVKAIYNSEGWKQRIKRA